MEAIDAGADSQVDAPTIILVLGVVAGATIAADGGVAGVEVLAMVAQVLLATVAPERPWQVLTRAIVAWIVLCTLVNVVRAGAAFIAC